MYPVSNRQNYFILLATCYETGHKIGSLLIMGNYLSNFFSPEEEDEEVEVLWPSLLLLLMLVVVEEACAVSVKRNKKYAVVYSALFKVLTVSF